jgi:hypothetical protein
MQEVKFITYRKIRKRRKEKKENCSVACTPVFSFRGVQDPKSENSLI